ncbi:MAG: site-2 protease family protein [Thermoleophilia bacterium]|nr:site-2 protease family protein [Thermoleophilia bacterium]
MRWSWKIFTAFGIGVRVHLTFLLIVAYFAYVWGVVQKPGGVGGAFYGVLLVLLLFALVTIHELTHSRVAQAYGIKVKNITLLPIGGMSAMESMPEDPRQELVISAAGPLSNLVLAGIMALFAPLLVDTTDLTSYGRFADLILSRTFEGAYVYLLATNILLAVFNLLPAFPMDGGRVFRAFLALRMDKGRATRVAVAVGQGLALAMGLLGFLSGNFLLILVAIFIYFGAQAEGAGEDVGRVLGALRVSQAVNTRVEVARPGQTIGELAARLFHIYQEDFPVVGDTGEVAGIVTRDRLISALAQHGPDYPVVDAMRSDYPAVRLSDSVFDTFMTMRRRNFKAAPVIDDGRLVGMVSLEDISEVYALLSAAGPDLVRKVPAEPRDTGWNAPSGEGGSGL